MLIVKTSSNHMEKYKGNCGKSPARGNTINTVVTKLSGLLCMYANIYTII